MKKNKDYGFLRVAAAVPRVRIADPGANAAAVCSLVDKAFEKGVSLLAFPELSVTGYSCADLFGQESLLDAAEKAIMTIRDHSRGKSVTIVAGAPIRHGGRLYDCAVVIRDGNVLGVVPRMHVSGSGGAQGARWFSSGSDFLSFNGRSSSPVYDDGKNLFREGFSPLVEICSQRVNISPNQIFSIGKADVAVEVGEDMQATVPPSSWHALAGADVIVNISASNELVVKDDARRKHILDQSGRTLSGYIYCSCGYGESTQDVVYAGSSLICEKGKALAEGVRFGKGDDLIVSDIDVERLHAFRRRSGCFGALAPDGRRDADFASLYSIIRAGDAADTDFEAHLCRYVEPHPFVPAGNPSEVDRRAGEITSIQVQGLATRLEHIGCKKAVIGISGGLDSTLALLVSVMAFDALGLPRKGIIGVTMPGFGTTDRTHSNASGLMEALGVTSREISIVPSVLQHFKDIGQDPDRHDVTYENAQARERTQILMDIANMEGGLVVGTGDLSELALGWCTYNGDHMCMYGVNAGVPKTLVKYLVKWAADNRFSGNGDVRNILLDIVDTPISPELTPADSNGVIAQKTEDIVGPYELHDFFLYHFSRSGCSPSKLYFLARKAFLEGGNGGDSSFSGPEGTAHAYDRDTILKWLKVFYRRFFSQQFKRSCLPDGPKVGTVSLSPRGDWQMPSDAASSLFLEELEGL